MNPSSPVDEDALSSLLTHIDALHRPAGPKPSTTTTTTTITTAPSSSSSSSSIESIASIPEDSNSKPAWAPGTGYTTGHRSMDDEMGVHSALERQRQREQRTCDETCVLVSEVCRQLLSVAGAGAGAGARAGQGGAGSPITPVTVSVQCPETRLGDTVGIVGSAEALGRWSPQAATWLETSDAMFPFWSRVVSLPAGQRVWYKFVIRRADGFVDWEEGLEDRQYSVPVLPAGLAPVASICDTWSSVEGNIAVGLPEVATLSETTSDDGDHVRDWGSVAGLLRASSLPSVLLSVVKNAVYFESHPWLLLHVLRCVRLLGLSSVLRDAVSTVVPSLFPTVLKSVSSAEGSGWLHSNDHRVAVVHRFLMYVGHCLDPSRYSLLASPPPSPPTSPAGSAACPAPSWLSSASEASAAYVNGMKPLLLRRGSFATGSYFRDAARDESLPRTATRRVFSELRSLRTTLPLAFESSVFLAVDRHRPNVMQALITGPADTPYSHGAFLFDIFVGERYPQAPPRVHFLSTNGNRVRMSPNVYASGKVCLSLLGTWHASSATERWSPSSSSLLQVLVSIQSLIFGVKYPILNEPGYEFTNLESPEGAKFARTAKNGGWERTRAGTLQVGVLSQLRTPPPGWETVIKRHFGLKKAAVLETCAEWLADAEASDTPGYKETVTHLVKEIRKELEALEE